MGREEGSGWGPREYLWRIHFDIWQNQYNIVKFKNKIKFKKIIIGTVLEDAVVFLFHLQMHQSSRISEVFIKN